MEVRCDHCGQVQKVADNIFGKREKVDLPCPGCGKSIRVVNPKLATFRVEATRKKVPSITSEVAEDGRLLRLPEGLAFSLEVLEGKEKGTVYPVDKPRITIGRANADVVISDKLVSRVHCALEISDEQVLLRDLGSTNGTLVNNKPIERAELSGGSTFRVGEHVFRLVMKSKGT